MSQPVRSEADVKRAESLRAELVAIAGHEKAIRERRSEIERELRRLDLKPQVDEWRRILSMPSKPRGPSGGPDPRCPERD